MHSGTFTSSNKKEFVFTMDANSYGEVNLVFVKFRDKLDSKFAMVYARCVVDIGSRLAGLRTQEERRDLAIHLYDVLKYLLDSLSDVDVYDEDELVRCWILKLIMHLSSKYSSLGVNHAVLYSLSAPKDEITNSGYFRFKYKQRSIARLTQVLREIHFLSEDPNDGNIFRDIILSDFPPKLAQPLTITCEVQKAAYIFSKLKDLFYNMTFENIEESRCFLNKHSKHFTANTISVSKSKFLNDPSKSDQKDEVDTAFKHLERIEN